MGKLRIEPTHKRKKRKKEIIENLLKVNLQVQFSHAVTVNPHELYFEAYWTKFYRMDFKILGQKKKKKSA